MSCYVKGKAKGRTALRGSHRVGPVAAGVGSTRWKGPPASASGPGDEVGRVRQSGGTVLRAAAWEPTDKCRDRAFAACGCAVPVDGRCLGRPERWRGHVLWGCADGGGVGRPVGGVAVEGQQVESAVVLTRCVPDEWAWRLLNAGRLLVVGCGACGKGPVSGLQGRMRRSPR